MKNKTFDISKGHYKIIWIFKIIDENTPPQKYIYDPESGPEVPTKHRRTIFGNSLELEYHRPNNVLLVTSNIYCELHVKSMS